MSIPGSALALLGSGAGAADYTIERSLRFNDGDSAYLSRTPSSVGDKFIWTFSFWIKLNKVDGQRQILTRYLDSSNDSLIKINSNGHLEIWNYRSGSYQTQYISNAQFRDPSSWYHFVIAANNSTSLDAWVNGEAITWSTSSGPNGVAWLFNGTGSHQIGRYNTTSNSDFQLAEVQWVDGTALTESDFGEYDANGVWQPKEYSGTYGTNGFYLDFLDNSGPTSGSNAGIGKDVSGNGNYFDSTNISAAAPTPVYSSTHGSDITSSELAKLLDGDNSTYASASGDLIGFSYSGNSITMKVGNTDTNNSQLTFIIQPFVNNIQTQSGTWSNVSVGSVASNTNFWNIPGGSTGTGTFTFPATWDGNFRIYLGGWSSAFRMYSLDAAPSESVNIDSLIDSPTDYEADSGNNGGNYALLNPLISPASAHLSDGNLKIAATTTSWVQATSTIGVNSGKWYWEVLFEGTNTLIGVTSNPNSGSYIGQVTGSYGRDAGGGYYINGSNGTGYTSFASGTTLGVALDMDNGTVTLYFNGSAESTFATGLDTSKTFYAGVSVYGSTSKNTINFGQRPFAYTPPTGHKSLCTQNFDDPLIADGSDYFDVKTYDGSANYPTTSTYAQNITGLGFSPDLVWIKNRHSNVSHSLFDTVRGIGASLSSDLPNAEYVDTSAMVTNFTSDGFEVTDDPADSSDTTGWGVNIVGQDYVAWAWDAGANSNKTYNVTVVNDSGNKYRFDGHGTSAVTLNLEEGSTYVFDASDSSVDGHPFVLGTAANSGAYSTGVTYTLDGVTKTYSQYTTVGDFNAATTRKLTITVPSGAPTLYYWCSQHPGMGGQINTNSTAGATVLSGSLNSSVYNQSQTWSDLVTGTLETTFGNSSATVPFDGDTGSNYTDGIRPEAGYYLSMNFGTTFANATSVKIYGHASLDGSSYAGANENLKINGTAIGASDWVNNGGGSGQSSATFTLSGGLTSLDWGYSSGSQSTGYLYLQGIEVDGKLLTDQGVTPSVVYPSITSTVRANPTAGFSIVTWTGNSGTVGHGLNATPGLIISKIRNGSSAWPVQHSYDTSQFLLLDEPDQATSDTTRFGAAPTSSVFSVGSWWNSTSDGVAYCFAPVEGYSAFGSYTGNGDVNNDGTFVYTGFKIAYLLIKDVDNSNAWIVWDNTRQDFNAQGPYLQPQGYTTEGDTDYLDFLSNGFKWRTTNDSMNASGRTYIYAAFAEHPFKTARAR